MLPWLKILGQAAKAWNADNAFKHSAAVSFYTLFSLAPVTIIAVTVAGLFLGRDAATHQLEVQMTQLVGPASAETILAAAKASQKAPESPWATALGVGLVIFGATTVFGQLQDSMNKIWGVRAKPGKSGWVILLLHRLVSFAMVLTLAFLLLVSLVLTTMLTSVTGRFIGDNPTLLKVLDLGGSIVVITLLFTLLFKVMPDVRQRWRDALLGAAVTAVLFTLGRYLIAFYLGRSTVASIYGAAGSLVALLVWIYYSCAILFFGVEFIRAYRHARRLKVQPKETAVQVREEFVTSKARSRA
jgi:membrane protein